MRRKGFDRMQQFVERPENRISLLIIFFWPRLNQKMHVIRHHTDREQFVVSVVKVPESIEHNCASFWRQTAPRLRANRHSVNRPWFVEMRKATARIESAILWLSFNKSPRRRDAVANTRDACTTRIKQR